MRQDLSALMRACITTMCLMVPTGVMAQAGAAVSQDRTIVNLRGDLYLARFDERATLFLVTPGGIVVTDPISTDAAKWLRGEFAQRFPGVAVRYILISHHHFDRAAGAGVFGDGAETVAHRLFNEELQSARRASVYADVNPVKRVYDKRERIVIGGRNVEMLYAGPVHARDLSVVYFPGERVVFAVDTLNVDTTPYSFGPYSPSDVAAWLDVVAGLDFDLMVDGAGETMDSTAVRQLKPYVRNLVDAVTQEVIAGRTLGRVRSEILLPGFQNDPNYPARSQQVERIYRSLTVHRWNASLAAVGSMSSTTSYCVGYATCTPFGGVQAAVTAGLEYSFGPYGFGVEFSGGQQQVVSRSTQSYDDSVANRRSTSSFMGRYRIGLGAVAADVVAGVTLVTSDTRGLNLVRDAEIPLGGFHGIISSQTFTGSVVGVDMVVPLAARWVVKVPVRFSTVGTGNDELHPGSRTVQVGVGLGFRLGQTVYHTPGEALPIVVRSGQPATTGHP
jgi:glyoxylase-like metal-dependent hydrolase (beta-lactamase superfamily II)